MKRFALLVLCLVALAIPALADNGVGDVSAYSDNVGNDCNITAGGGNAQVHVYIVHKFLPGEASTYCRFKGVFPAEMLFLGFNTGTFISIGQFQTDISVAYGVCVNATTLVGDALFLSTAPAPACSYFNVVAADGQATPLATDCNFGEYIVAVGQGIINPDQNCQCTIATEQTSWGKVKSLYR